MHGETTHGKGSASRIRSKKKYDDNFDQIRFPSLRLPSLRSTDVYYRVQLPVDHINVKLVVNRDNAVTCKELQ